VPGIGPSPDRMLQARLVSYADAHLHRLGVNHHQVPVNAPVTPPANFIRDGALTTGGYGARPNYWPNSLAGTPAPDPSFADPAWQLGSAIADRYDSTVGHDDFTQAGDLYRLFDEGERARLTTRIAGALGQARREVQLRQLGHFLRADAEYGQRVAEALGLVSELAELSGAGALAGAR
jgi:catalase